MSKRVVLADTHVHLYPSYSMVEVFRSAIRNMRCDSDPIRALFLTERAHNSAFENLEALTRDTPIEVLLTPSLEVKLLSCDGNELYIVAGSQCSTAERLEILLLGTMSRVPDGLPFPESFDRALATGATLVLPWSPGKWTGKRSALIRSVIDTCDPQRIAVGDIPIRSSLAPPDIFELARSRAIPRYAGSDPLPFSHDLEQIGKYRMRALAPFSVTEPKESLLRAVRSGTIEGDRNSLLKASYRWVRTAAGR